VSATGLAVLEALPCWTMVRLYDRGFDEDTCVHFLSNFLPRNRLVIDQPIKSIRFSQEHISDAELQLLREVPELEEVAISEAWDVTAQGLLYLADLRKLKSLSISKLRRKDGEAVAAWLARLEGLGACGVPQHLRRALALSIGYARYLAHRDGEGAPEQAAGPTPPPDTPAPQDRTLPPRPA
jgi:hypothetical protein